MVFANPIMRERRNMTYKSMKEFFEERHGDIVKKDLAKYKTVFFDTLVDREKTSN